MPVAIKGCDRPRLERTFGHRITSILYRCPTQSAVSCSGAIAPGMGANINTPELIAQGALGFTRGVVPMAKHRITIEVKIDVAKCLWVLAIFVMSLLL